MVKLLNSARFPQSVQLFRFCRRVLEFRHPSQKIGDQLVGKLLNLSPSDTSQWKRGKKLIKNIESLKTLAQSLNIDFDILQDLLEGAIFLDEAWCDFNNAEEERLSLQQKSSCYVQSTRSIILEKLATHILTQASCINIPIDLSKLLNVFPFIQLLPSDTTDKLATSVRVKPGHYIIRYLKGNSRPHTRMAIAREIAHIVLFAERERYSCLSGTELYTRSEILTLSHALLMPQAEFVHAVQKLSAGENAITSLAHTFAVPKFAVHKRLETLLLVASTHLN